MVKIKNAKLVKIGDSYGFTVPKALRDAELVEKDKEYDLEVTLSD